MLYPRFGKPRRKPVYRPYAWSFVSGVLVALCFPRVEMYQLAWVALAPFLVSLYELKPAGAFKAGMLMGLPYFFGTQYWIYHSINHYGGINFVSSLAIVFLLAMFLSLYTALFGLLFSYSIRSSDMPALFLAPVYWVVLELLRSYAFTGFPWSSIGYSQYRFLGAIQFADITGIYGVSFLLLAVNGAVADYFIAKKRRQETPLANLWPTAIGLAVLVLFVLSVFGYGQYRLKQHRAGKTVRVSVVQGNIRQDVKWDPLYQREVVDTYKGLTASAAGSFPDIVVWPETAVPFYWERDAGYTREIREFAGNLNADLLFGAVTVRGEGLLANSAVHIGPGGTVGHVQDKIHLVPFGEYVPLKSVLGFVNRLVEGAGEYVPGKTYTKADSRAGKFGTLICYEVIFPGLVRKFYKDGGDFIVNITNDAWFGDTAGPYQHFSMAVFRAVENRKPLVRAANTGISGFIDSNGRILDSLPLFKQGVLTRGIETDTTRTFYSRFGDLFSYLCIIITVMLFANIRRR